MNALYVYTNALFLSFAIGAIVMWWGILFGYEMARRREVRK